MPSVRKFHFDESFDTELPYTVRRAAEDAARRAAEAPIEPEPEPEPEPDIPPPPTFSEEELAEARERGRAEGVREGDAVGYGRGFGEGMARGMAEGREAGRGEAEARIEARFADAAERIVAGFRDLIAAREAKNEETRRLPVVLAMAAIRKIMPELTRRGGLAEIEGLITSLTAELIDEPRLTIRVAPETAEELRERLAASRILDPDAKLMVIGDPVFEIGDCRVEWADGGAERDTQKLLSDIEAIALRLPTTDEPASEDAAIPS